MFRLYTRPPIKKSISRLSRTTLLRSVNKRTIIDISDLKNTYRKLKEKRFSPLYAAILSHGTLENLYDYPFQSATTGLTRFMFHKQDNQLKQTELKTSPAYSLNPKLLASIIYHHSFGTLNNESYNLYQSWNKNHKDSTGRKISKIRTFQFLIY